jgi:hypothetical protein
MTDLFSLTINELVAAFYEGPGIVSTKYLVLEFTGRKIPRAWQPLSVMPWNRRKNATAIVVAVIAVLFVGWFAFSRANRAPLSQREIATRVLAEYVRKSANPHAVLVLSNPYTQKPGSPLTFTISKRPAWPVCVKASNPSK